MVQQRAWRRRWLPVLLAAVALSCSGREGSAPPPGEAAKRSPCLGLSREACFADSKCEAIPYWGESLVACNTDERGFSSNCPFEGCRPLGADCPSLQDLVLKCPKYCSYNSYSVDPGTGCRTCECAGDGSPS